MGKFSKRATKPLAADEPVNRLTASYPLDKPARTGQQAELSEAVATETQAEKPSSKTTPEGEPSKLVVPLAAAWPKTTLTEPPKVPEKAPTPATPQSVKETFVLLDLGAKQVSLCGDFNGWASGATPMKQNGGGHWETTVALAPGTYQYKFLVDGEWIPDPLAHKHVWNQHGTLNSVVEVRA